MSSLSDAIQTVRNLALSSASQLHTSPHTGSHNDIGHDDPEVTENGKMPNEQSSLLPKQVEDPNESGSPNEGEVYELEDGEMPKNKLVLHEFWVLFKGSVPVIAAYSLQNSLQTLSV